MRLEDLGKKLLANAEPLDDEVILKIFNMFFEDNPISEYFLLLSKEVDYYTVFRRSIDESDADSLLNYFENSYFGKDDTMISMRDIVNLELREDGSLEIWIGTTYFHLAPFDWGVEQL